MAECSDPGRDWFPQMTVCFATREQAAAKRRWDELHPDVKDGEPWHDGNGHWSAESSAEFPYHRNDGVTIFVSQEDLGLGGDFLQLEKRSRQPE